MPDYGRKELDVIAYGITFIDMNLVHRASNVISLAIDEKSMYSSIN